MGRYVVQFAGKDNVRNADTIAQMVDVAAALVGRRSTHRDLVARLYGQFLSRNVSRWAYSD